MCVTLSLSVFSAGLLEESESEYLTVSTVCASFVVCGSEETVSSTLRWRKNFEHKSQTCSLKEDVLTFFSC